MTEDELKTIEARLSGRVFVTIPEADVLALVAEVRRLRGFMKRGDLAEMDFFDKRDAAERAARIGHMGGLSTKGLHEIARAITYWCPKLGCGWAGARPGFQGTAGDPCPECGTKLEGKCIK
jgi:hypothetical protein